MPERTPVSRRAVLRTSAAGLAGAVGIGLGRGATSTDVGGTEPAYAGSGYRLAIGDLHSHTAYSDGAPNTRPAEAFAACREAGLDFKAVSDHSEWLATPLEADESCLDPTTERNPTDCVISPTEDPDGLRKWPATREQAMAASTDAFLGLRAFEWSSPYQGHVVVHGTRHFSTAYETGGATMHGFWEWFTRDVGRGGGADGLAFFAHPGREPRTFEGFRYVPEAADRVVGCEVFNRDDQYFEGGLAAALDAGWRVGAVGSTDNHAARLSRPARPKTALVVPQDAPWNRETAYDALRARRFYATYNEDLQLRFRAAGHEMGSTVHAPAGESVRLRVDAFDPSNPASIEAVVLFTSGGREVARTTLDAPDRRATLTHDPTVPADGTDWYLAKVVGVDGRRGPDRGSAYSSPLWLTAA